jgi:Zn ribbon nucleic-acid-binding protein
MRDNQMSENQYLDAGEDVVQPGMECPNCREYRIDWLVWMDDDSDFVCCQSCGTEYEPGRQEAPNAS